jgi:hypothetical protein
MRTDMMLKVTFRNFANAPKVTHDMKQAVVANSYAMRDFHTTWRTLGEGGGLCLCSAVLCLLTKCLQCRAGQCSAY